MQLFFLLVLDFGGVGQCALLHHTNFFAIVAGGKYPKTSLKTVLFYDAVKKIFVLETNFSSPVKAVRMKRDKLVKLFVKKFNILLVKNVTVIFGTTFY
jgi:hypothetical protein